MIDQIATPIEITDLLRIVVVGLFGLIIFMSFIYGALLGWIIKRRDPKNDFHKEPTRVIGGLSVLVIAIVANNPYIYGAALFIGGLLIASEKFMINLAAIFNSDRKSVHKISEQWKEANDDHVEQKQEAEAEEGALIDETQGIVVTPKDIKSVEQQELELKTATNTRLSRIKEIERIALGYIEDLVISPTKAVKRYVESLDSKEGREIYDAIVIDRRSSHVLFGVEVIYRPTLLPNALRISLKRLINRRSGHFPLLVLVVCDSYKDWDKDKLVKYKLDLKKHYPDISFAFYSEKHKSLDALDEIDFLDLLKNT